MNTPSQPPVPWPGGGTPEAGAEHDTTDAWERFVAGESLVACRLPKHVLSSWQRSLRFGVEPGARTAPLAVRGDELERLRQRNRDLLWAAQGIFMASSHLLAKSCSIMLLTDANGVVLEAAGDPRTLDAAQHIQLVTGGHWHEKVVGTNGIGTALATRHAVQVHAAQHFCEGIKRWTCAASPVFVPGTDQVLGVIDISGPPETFQVNNLALAVACARQIESVLAERATREHTQLLEACLRHQGRADAAAMVVLDRNAHIVHASGSLPPEATAKLGECLRGGPIGGWGAQLPDGIRPEWLHPVRAEGAAIGALLVVPRGRTLGRPLLPAPGAAPRREPMTAVDQEAADAASASPEGLGRMVGGSLVFRAAVQRARQLGRRRVAVLIQGETGVGKELFARALHDEERRGGPFVAFNCGAATKELIGAELFGHVRGAFTGATNEGRAGRFELAHGGTLCLDEIGELPLELQPVLLRALEEGVVYRLGDATPRRVDVRLLAMTHRDLLDDIRAGRFRRDLYHRIGVTRVQVPPLRERGDDLALLVDHFVAKLTERHGVPSRRFGPAVMARLQAYAWPGNVRELRNLIEGLLLTGDDEEVQPHELPDELLGETGEAPPAAAGASLEEAERRTIAQVVQRAQGNLAQAARALGISRSTLYRKLERYRLENLLVRHPHDAD